MRKIRSIKDRTYANNKEKWYDIIFGADTIEGRRFDIWLLWAILASVLAIMAESVPSIDKRYGNELRIMEYGFTILFTIEYLVRIYISHNPKKYILSFWGIIDLVSTIPTYLAFFFAGPGVFSVLRIVRMLRVFRVLRLTSFLVEARGLGQAIKRSSAKIVVFFGIVLISVVVMGTAMYIIEPEESGFTSIPRSIYWAIVTITTVGYGDIAPTTALGQFLSAVLMILGYAVIAVPTGIVSVELNQKQLDHACQQCGNNENDVDAKYCKRCGNQLS
jgi:voltage-gated potassium channel